MGTEVPCSGAMLSLKHALRAGCGEFKNLASLSVATPMSLGGLPCPHVPHTWSLAPADQDESSLHSHSSLPSGFATLGCHQDVGGGGWGFSSVECSPHKHKTLSWIPSTEKKDMWGLSYVWKIEGVFQVQCGPSSQLPPLSVPYPGLCSAVGWPG